MINQANLGFQLCGRRRHIETNEVHLQKMEIEFEKHGPECKHVVAGEEVEFRIIVKNKSEMEVRGVIFSDPLSRDFEYVRHSFHVDGQQRLPIIFRHTIYHLLGTLSPGEEKVITFKVCILKEQREENLWAPPWGPGGLPPFFRLVGDDIEQVSTD